MVDMWTATLETSTRCDTICKGEGQQEDGEHTNRKSPQTRRWPVGSIYHRSVGRSRVGPAQKQGERGGPMLLASQQGQARH